MEKTKTRFYLDDGEVIYEATGLPDLDLGKRSLYAIQDSDRAWMFQMVKVLAHNYHLGSDGYLHYEYLVELYREPMSRGERFDFSRSLS